MGKRTKIISIVVILLIIAGGSYFLAGKFGKLPSGKVVYVQPSVASLAQQSDQQPTDNGQQISDSSNQLASTSGDNNLSTQGGSSVISLPAGEAGHQNANASQQTGSSVNNDQIANNSSGKIVPRFASWGFQKSSGRTIDTIIIHSSYDATGSDPFNVDGVIAEWKALGVSPHYLIARDGTTYQLVADQDIAYHAGVSKMPSPDNRTNVNNFSIGVEMINTLDGKFTDAQYSSLNSLIANLKAKYPIKNILGHDQISPGRKTDPWGIDWGKVQK